MVAPTLGISSLVGFLLLPNNSNISGGKSEKQWLHSSLCELSGVGWCRLGLAAGSVALGHSCKSAGHWLI